MDPLPSTLEAHRLDPCQTDLIEQREEQLYQGLRAGMTDFAR